LVGEDSVVELLREDRAGDGFSESPEIVEDSADGVRHGINEAVNDVLIRMIAALGEG
jgi:hypothetical protein